MGYDIPIYNNHKEKVMVKLATEKSIKELAQEELKSEKVREATIELKSLYRRLESAQKIVRNIEREIEDYLEELEE